MRSDDDGKEVYNNLNYNGQVEAKELESALIELYLQKEQQLRDRFDRSLPLAEGILDNRWERAARLGFGFNTSIYDSALVYGKVEVGEESWIGPSVILDGSGGSVKIGDYCSIAAGVHIYTHDTVLWALAGGKAGRRKASVEIGSCCHIGAQSVVLPGVRIERQCVVAANSVVNRSVETKTIVAGNPARKIGRVEGEGEDTRMIIDTNRMIASPCSYE